MQMTSVVTRTKRRRVTEETEKGIKAVKRESTPEEEMRRSGRAFGRTQKGRGSSACRHPRRLSSPLSWFPQLLEVTNPKRTEAVGQSSSGETCSKGDEVGDDDDEDDDDDDDDDDDEWEENEEENADDHDGGEEKEKDDEEKSKSPESKSSSDDDYDSDDDNDKSMPTEIKDAYDGDDGDGDERVSSETKDVGEGDDAADSNDSVPAELNGSLNGSHANDSGGNEAPAETTDDSDQASVTEIVDLPAGSDMDKNAILEMKDELGGSVLPAVNDMDENPVLQMIEEIGGNELPAVNNMDENAVLQMIHKPGGNEPAEINNAVDDDNNNGNMISMWPLR
ncbi:nucleolin-like [Dioscorea cayenensis subsp. rotundata]|uniref:Nucleolin-like n=1 Tax=Dioscorea cayennensis subsp. rotundata TaxID=55577 RepID=A0AB40C4I9_DIOCR|nr:nucleolin-like [Dioscorea cayenensis subsp. rotundata]